MAKAKKQGKPYRDFPLYLHATGQWAKTIMGKKYYFGSDRDKALKAYKQQRDALYAGEGQPQVKHGGETVSDAIGAFRAAKEAKFEGHELSARSLAEYAAVCKVISQVLGKDTALAAITTDDLQRLRRKLSLGKDGKPTSPVSFKRKLTYARSVFLLANEEFPDCHVRYRKALVSPSAKLVRKHRNEIGERLFTADEIRKLLDVAGEQMRAMILLGITCGFGNRDCATLPIERVDLVSGWHNYERPKTQNPRRAPLTPECAAALYRVIKGRKSGLVFVTKYGQPWFHDGETRDPISAEFRKLCKRVGIYRPKITMFYTLRRTFQTVADTSGEPQAVKFMMGHVAAADDMSSVYRQKVYDVACLRVSDHLRRWIAGEITLT